jgi:hypothetical protein
MRQGSNKGDREVNTMKERAVKAMQDKPERRSWTLEELRLAAGVSMRARWRLCKQLMDDGRVLHRRGNVFVLDATD